MRQRFMNSVQKAGSSTTCYNPRFRENKGKEPLMMTSTSSAKKSSDVKYVRVKFFDGSIEVSLREYMDHKTLALL